MPELLTIPIDQITVVEGRNVRTSFDQDGLDELAASIQRFGVLQPILVKPNGNGRYELIAGERRLRAATAVGLGDIPAFERREDALHVAIVENLQRQQLTPIEEAHAFKRGVDAGLTHAELAAAVGCTEHLVTSRLGLLELPASVQGHIDAGDLTLAGANALRKIASAGDKIVEKAAELVAAGRGADTWGDPITSGDLERDPAWVVDQVIDELDEAERPFLEHVYDYRSFDPNGIPWPEDLDVADLHEKWRCLDGYNAKHESWRNMGFRFQEADVDAARAYGCLLELDGQRGGEQWITDPAWLAARLNDNADAAIAKKEKADRAAAKKAGAESPADAVADDKDRAREERAQAKADALAARERNVTLGIALYKGMHAPKITEEAMRLLATLIDCYIGDDIGMLGFRFSDESSQTVVTKKDGTISRVEHVKTVTAARDLFEKRLGAAKTPQQILGVLLQGLVAAKFTDKTAVPQGQRTGTIRGIGYSYTDRDRRIASLIDQVAMPVLPPEIVEQIRAERAALEAEHQEALERDVAAIRAGNSRCPHCGESGCKCTDDEIKGAVACCPHCAEPDCWASCSGFAIALAQDEEAKETVAA